MALTAPTSQYKSVAHGALNWDTQLKADVIAYESMINNLVGIGAGFSYAGSCKDYSTSAGWATFVQTGGNFVNLALGFDPGANGLNTGASSLVGQITGTFAYPLVNQIIPCDVAPGGTFAGAKCTLQLGRDGSVKVVYTSGSLSSGMLVAGSVTFRVQ